MFYSTEANKQNRMEMFEQFGANAVRVVWHFTQNHSGQKESKRQQRSNKQQMLALTSKNNKVFIDKAFETTG